MARQTQDREDLLHEATALEPRFLLQVKLQGHPVEVFAGFRCGQAVSLYFDSDPVYHFNSQGQLRRAYLDGSLLKADQGQLVAWSPQRSPQSTTMERRTLSLDDQKLVGDALYERLQKLNNLIARQEFSLAGEIPPAGNAVDRFTQWLQSLPAFSVAASPNVS